MMPRELTLLLVAFCAILPYTFSMAIPITNLSANPNSNSSLSDGVVHCEWDKNSAPFYILIKNQDTASSVKIRRSRHCLL